MKKIFLFSAAVIAAFLLSNCSNEKVHKALIVTGQNNHNWQASSPVLKQILEETGMFTAEIVTTPEKGGDMSTFKPDFSKYKLVILDYTGDSWPEETNKAFVDYVNNGGGVVVYHFACSAFPGWKEYNEMIGLGGWGNRSEKDGPYVYYSRDKLIIDTAAGKAGSHGKSREFMVRGRDLEHPIMKGLPARWMHANDELYSELRGPAKNLQILATAFADSTKGGGTMRDEPVLMAITYGKGRIFHTALGHAEEGGGPAMQSVGFIVTLQRGAEWAVTGTVTQSLPADFPTSAGIVLRTNYKPMSLEEAYEELAQYDIGKSTKCLTLLQSHIKELNGNSSALLEVEKKLVEILKSPVASVEGKKLIIRELSWMGTDYSIPALKESGSIADLKDEAEFALARLQ